MPPPHKSQQNINLQQLYSNRFEKNAKEKQSVWKVLCKHFFQKFIPKDAIVMDIAAGNCEFINNIEAQEKIAFDFNPDVALYAGKNVHAINDSFFNMGTHLQKKCDIIFASNVLEHLDNKEAVIVAIKLCYENLNQGGKLLILQPNIRFVKGEYWDFIDHKVPLTDKAFIEAGRLVGFTAVYTLVRFLPYTTQSKVPQHPLLVWLYLKIPLAWFIFGKQSFLILEKR